MRAFHVTESSINLHLSLAIISDTCHTNIMFQHKYLVNLCKHWITSSTTTWFEQDS